MLFSSLTQIYGQVGGPVNYHLLADLFPTLAPALLLLMVPTLATVSELWDISCGLCPQGSSDSHRYSSWLPIFSTTCVAKSLNYTVPLCYTDLLVLPLSWLIKLLNTS